ncbi:hypothetical protein [Aggregatibacter actinomycetemcomitans]|uniref:hypothetical protein n=1 Tax=Aggregatibacter actinomycetemcomitans TaxID=714 RepID=UPI001651DDB3|nr:hypothetical protein [Aggregatibacter actinomycetemcomitans]
MNNNINKQQLYAIEFLGINDEPLAYCNVEISINGYLLSDLPLQADQNGRWIFHPSLVEQEGEERLIKVVFWNDQYPKTEHSEVPAFTWLKGKKVARLRVYNIYEITPRTIPNEKGDPATYKRPYHIVRQGDTWEIIEKEAGVNRYALIWENGLDEATPISSLVGKKIYFPKGIRKQKTEIKKASSSESKKSENKSSTNDKPIDNKKKSVPTSEQKVEDKQKAKQPPVEGKKEETQVMQGRSESNGKPVDTVIGSNRENGHYYNKKTGEFEGEIKDGIGSRDRVFSCIGKKDENYENSQLLPIKHSEFRISANIIRHETRTPGLECICIAFTARNKAKRDKKSIYKLLMSGYSSVPKGKKTEMEIHIKDRLSLDSRKGLILALLNEKDPTNGAEFWDSTDFLAWGLKNPSGESHAKFRQYTKITISKSIFDQYVMEQKKHYKSGKVRYNGTYYSIPATVFTDPSNWKSGNFVYETGMKKPPAEGALEASIVAGHTIFWRVIR